MKDEVEQEKQVCTFFFIFYLSCFIFGFAATNLQSFI